MTTFTPEAIEAARKEHALAMAELFDPKRGMAWGSAVVEAKTNEAWSRALTAAEAAMEAAGLVRVPVEPTTHMLNYGYAQRRARDTAVTWRAMIAARPKDKG